MPEDELLSRVRRLGRTVMTDGMEIDGDGNVNFCSLELKGIVRCGVQEGQAQCQVVVQDERLHWPDSMARRQSLYFTTSQMNLGRAFP